MPQSTSSSSGVGFCGLLTVAFVVLKLCHVIEWSWWWVLSPLWISAVVAFIIFVIALVVLQIKRPRTPEAKAAAACERMAQILRNNRR